MTAEYIHMATNHLPYLGLGLATLPLLVGLLGRNKAALVSGLLLTFICGWSVLLVMDTGRGAAERYELASQIRIDLDADAKRFIEAHREDAETFSKVMYAAATFATISLLLCSVGSTLAYPVSWMVVILNLASLAGGLLVADSGYKIRRTDFRAEYRIESSAEYPPQAIHGQFDVFT